MQLITRIAAIRARLDDARGQGQGIGLVPTMGYLHQGHASLIERAAAESDFGAVTIFVNPLQFGPAEDLARYPRDLERDLGVCEAAGADLVFAPPVEEMYPEPVVTSVAVDELSTPLEGACRPDHFAGVTTVVAKFLNIAGPCRAYFGEKDYQQLVVVRRMVADLSFPVEVVGCPTVRENDGLALSSRNGYLTPEQRAAAPVLIRALRAGVDAIEVGERDPKVVSALMQKLIEAEPLARVEYAEAVNAATLRSVSPLAGEIRLLAAARLGAARLIDNLGVTVENDPFEAAPTE